MPCLACHRVPDASLTALRPSRTAELLAEIAAERGIQVVVDRKLDEYADLAPAALEATGGDRFWPVPVREIRS